MTRAVPVNSQGAEVAIVTRSPAAAEKVSGAVISSTQTAAAKKASGGDTMTARRPLGLV